MTGSGETSAGGGTRAGSVLARRWPAAAMLVAMTLLNAWAGTLWPDRVPEHARSTREITGMSLMLILLPAYLLAAGAIVHRRSLALVETLRPLLDVDAEADAARARIEGALRRRWWVGVGVGLVLALLNTRPVGLWDRDFLAMELAHTAGQTLLWLTISLLLVARVESARAFRRLGDHLPVGLFQLERLRPLSASGIADVVLMAGALLFAPLQSLDGEFHWYNYQFGLLVALPATAFLLLWPVWPIHRRIVAERGRRLAETERRLAGLESASNASLDTPELETGGLETLELLLAHRDRVRTHPTWPFGSAALSRVLFYLVLPPLAWAGAALVERIVDALIG